MRLAVTFTINDRPDYLEQTLDSWSKVRGKENVVFSFSCEPRDWYASEGKCLQLVLDFLKKNKLVGRVYKNQTNFGVLHNPYVALQRAILPEYIDYAILAEDDLLVSDDILEYHTWAAETYVDDKDIAMVCSFLENPSAEQLADKVIRVPNFASVWIWGTWKDRWQEYIEPTWDHDYSTADEIALGGWDWHLNKRVLPSLNKYSLLPMGSRVQNIGEIGTHSNALVQSASFLEHREPAVYEELS